MDDLAPHGAVISADGRYRYALVRSTGAMFTSPADVDRTMTFVMLNPSTADATSDDPTIRRCIGFAEREECARLIVVNLYAYRATNPKALWHLDVDTARGPENREYLLRAMQAADVLVMAWGASLVERRIGQQLYRLPRYNVAAFCRDLGTVAPTCLGYTAQGQPRHPLYVPADAPLIPWEDR